MLSLKKIYVCIIYNQQTWEKLCQGQEIWSILQHAKVLQTFLLFHLLGLNLIIKFCILMNYLEGSYIWHKEIKH